MSRHDENTEQWILRQVRALARKEGLEAKVTNELWHWYVERDEPEWHEDTAVEDAWGTLRAEILNPSPVPREATRGAHRRRPFRETMSIAPPPYWVLHSRRLMRSYEPLQQEALRILGRSPASNGQESTPNERDFSPSFIPLAELGNVLHDAAEQEECRGEADVLWYPTFKHRIRRTALGIHWGYSNTEIQQDYWSAMKHVNPLYMIKTMAHTLVFDTHVHEADAVGFLLSDRPVVLPWIEIEATRTAALSSVTITVGSPVVSQEAVRQAYLKARRLLKEPDGGQSARSIWTGLLVDFVSEKRSEGLDWDAIFVAWNQGMGTEHRYDSLGGMQRSFYEARKNRSFEYGERESKQAFSF